MAGKNPLWVAKQHGHSIATMLRAYAAWAEGTAEVDVEAIKRSMNASEAPAGVKSGSKSVSSRSASGKTRAHSPPHAHCPLMR
jgi:hypothetical protein